MSLFSKPKLWCQRASLRQKVVAAAVGVSILGNLITIIGLVAIHQRRYDYWVANYSTQRMCARDLKANILDLKTDSNRAFYSVSNCSGLNYKTGKQMDGIKTMMDEIQASPESSDTVVAPSSVNYDFAGLLHPYQP